MSGVSLTGISVGLLLIITEQTCSSAAAVRAPRSACVNESELTERSEAFLRRRWHHVHLLPGHLAPRASSTCEQTAARAAGDKSDRSVSPWRYSINRDMTRIPHDIAFAECLCNGCIINQHEDMRYNSVPVTVQMMVLKKIDCHKSKYMLQRDFIKVPVACTCVVPKSTK
ncbi:interleukin-17C-like [Echeneis naucrates]|uniref:Interleukin-17C-like n=1 Tax=Echeneis naucrates TaxID=173247 RepID=A0A665V3W2_ECHNA|nr:interleukin-17C-like [Echeneis naucrates]